MKQIFTSKILRRVVILSLLLAGLMFVVSTSDNVQTAQAARCCRDCPGGGDPEVAEENCFNQCGGEYNSCFYTCRDRAFSCYATCSFCDGGGGGYDECQFDTQCMPGEFCINNHCS